MLEIGLFAADVEDLYGRTPFLFAASRGNKATVKIISHRPDVDVNKIANRIPLEIMATAPERAAQRGHARIVELLLEREDVNINRVSDSYHYMTLSSAAFTGSEAELRVLLKHKDIKADY